MQVDPFSDKQIALLQTFADQAVIAIENSRLFEAEQARTRELAEALEQKTATAEVLKVISSSPGQLEPVFQAMLANAVRICEAKFGTLFRYDEGAFRAVAFSGVPRALVEYQQQRGSFRPEFTRGGTLLRVWQTKDVVHSADASAEPDPGPAVRYGGARSIVGVPMFKESELVGAIIIYRQEVRPFTDKQIDLVKSFASQAVIAIENTRLFQAEQARTRELSERTRELAQALEYQTAISDVLGVIGRSKFELQPVLAAILSTGCRLCQAEDASIGLRQGDWLDFGFGQGTSWRSRVRVPINSGWTAGRAVLERQTIHIDDVTAASDEFPLGREHAASRGHRTVLAVPLLREDEAIGCLFLRRTKVQPFSEKQIALVATFADQAVIAIENVRLFEEIAQKSRELEIASQHKSQFVANMSHELRTPLAAMLGYAELLQEGIYGAQPEKSLPILTRIRSNGKHLLGLINTVLDISKIEAGQFKLNLAEYALGSIVDTVMVATESLAATKKLAFKTDVAKGLPYGLGDEQRLTQVLLNLVGNAIKFTDAGEVRITAGAANGHFSVSVSDTGPGIPAEECERIFEKFRQVDSSNTRAKGGTGLGLTIAREIVEMHGGRIWVESMLGQGSTFRMELPVRATVAVGAA
jgi:signal transduction histidine kinase